MKKFKFKNDPLDLIEVLRCAADLVTTGEVHTIPLCKATEYLGFPRTGEDDSIVCEAMDLRHQVKVDLGPNYPYDKAQLMLETARRIEEQVERENAILICDIAASVPRNGYRATYITVARDLGIVEDWTLGLNLALSAWDHLVKGDWTQELDAEAAQLLREGWTP